MPELVLYDEMCRAIAAAHSVDEVKDIRDKALAIEIYSRQARNIENVKRAIEIRIRPERRSGELLKEIERAKRGRPEKMSSATTFSDFGISRDQSSRRQKLAAVPEDEFEATFAQPGKPSSNGIISRNEPKKNGVHDDALWLWGQCWIPSAMGYCSKILATYAPVCLIT
jgi:hypothetical protein